MTEQVAIALIAASAGILGAIAGGGFGVWLGARYGAQKDRKDRLRALYSQVLEAAIRLTPKVLGYKLTEDADIPQPAEIDGFVAKLMLENEADEDKVRTAFVGVFNFAMLYGIEKADTDTPSAELQKTRKLVDENLAALQRAMRDRLR